MTIYISKKDFREEEYEFVERKGKGHPDTLSDALAETFSAKYSKYTKDKFGAVLHHNFDKVGLLGGASYVRFGEGYLTKPIRVLLNGRASTKFADTVIPIKEMLIEWTKEFMHQAFPMIDVDKDLEFHYNLSNQSSPGKTEEDKAQKGTRKYWFEPRGLFDLQETKKLFSNDTSMGVGYAPYTKLEQLVLAIEGKLNSKEFKQKYPWVGSDIKIMGFRFRDSFDITMCIPQISIYVANIDEYKQNMEFVRGVIFSIAQEMGIEKFDLHTNTRDNYENSELYLTVTGSSIESGDEGLVGRGNRINGIISPTRLMSMEGACGKNPVYHIGKIYYVAANEISKKIYNKFNIKNEVVLISQSGRDLLDPWIVCVSVPADFNNIASIEDYIKEEISRIPEYTKQLIEQQLQVF
ncbi:MAG: methionine adenosyltransferase [Alphaproteobacteria bacterium]|nr:methionine adenosyltransferase [Alphaproteobacteria bacterium]MBQ8436919.1 methionine adenosyltransferase [Alphaproteobacteria bacterium]MBQ8631399.1 methionine adenosyltransferase [Alphaproteobacteria bacterium]